MKICPNCQEENPVIAPVCRRCNTLLPEVPTEIVDLEEAPPGLKAIEQVASQRIESPQNTLTLLIPPEQSPLTKNFQDGDRLILGRASAERADPTIDLSPFGAVSLGVSREHAAITFSGGTGSIVDLGSSNGTWLNENRLEAHTAQPLRNGDMLRLGNMLVFTYFSSSSVSSQALILGERSQRATSSARYQLTPGYLSEKITPFVNLIFDIQSAFDCLLEVKTAGPEVVFIGVSKKQPGIEVQLRGVGTAIKFLREKISGTSIQPGRETPVTTVIQEENAQPKQAPAKPSESPAAQPKLPEGWDTRCDEFLAEIAPNVSDEARANYQKKILLYLVQLANSDFEIISVEN